MARLIVVEDSAELASLIASSARSRGHQAKEAHTGQAALAALVTQPFDIAVVDLLLPDMRGGEILAELKTRNIPSVVMSGVYKGERFQRDAQRLYGVRAYFEKPFDLRNLLDTLEDILGIKRDEHDDLEVLEPLEEVEDPDDDEPLGALLDVPIIKAKPAPQGVRSPAVPRPSGKADLDKVLSAALNLPVTKVSTPAAPPVAPAPPVALKPALQKADPFAEIPDESAPPVDVTVLLTEPISELEDSPEPAVAPPRLERKRGADSPGVASARAEPAPPKLERKRAGVASPLPFATDDVAPPRLERKQSPPTPDADEATSPGVPNLGRAVVPPPLPGARAPVLPADAPTIALDQAEITSAVASATSAAPATHPTAPEVSLADAPVEVTGEIPLVSAELVLPEGALPDASSGLPLARAADADAAEPARPGARGAAAQGMAGSTDSAEPGHAPHAAAQDAAPYSTAHVAASGSARGTVDGAPVLDAAVRLAHSPAHSATDDLALSAAADEPAHSAAHVTADELAHTAAHDTADGLAHSSAQDAADVLAHSGAHDTADELAHSSAQDAVDPVSRAVAQDAVDQLAHTSAHDAADQVAHSAAHGTADHVAHASAHGMADELAHSAAHESTSEISRSAAHGTVDELAHSATHASTSALSAAHDTTAKFAHASAVDRDELAHSAAQDAATGELAHSTAGELAHAPARGATAGFASSTADSESAELAHDSAAVATDELAHDADATAAERAPPAEHPGATGEPASFALRDASLDTTGESQTAALAPEQAAPVDGASPAAGSSVAVGASGATREAATPDSSDNLPDSWPAPGAEAATSPGVAPTAPPAAPEAESTEVWPFKEPGASDSDEESSLPSFGGDQSAADALSAAGFVDPVPASPPPGAREPAAVSSVRARARAARERAAASHRAQASSAEEAPTRAEDGVIPFAERKRTWEEAPRVTGRPARQTSAATAGDLRSSSVPRLLNAYYQAKHQGELRLRQGQVQKVVFFEAGKPIYAASNLAQERFARFCAGKGYLPEGSVAEVAQLAKEQNLRTGDAMIRLGLITPEQRRSLLEEQVKEIIWSTFTWKDGQYSFASKQPRWPDLVKLSVFPGDLILEGAAKGETLLTLREKMGRSRKLFPCADPPYALHEVSLSDPQAMLLAYADGTKTVEDLLALTDLVERDALASLHGLELIGLLEERRDDGKQRRISFGF